MKTPFDEEYFMDGVKSGRSNYENYHYLPGKTVPACAFIMRYMGIREGETLLDWGAGLGTYVRAFRELGVTAFGYDISRWAVENSDEQVRPYLCHRGALKECDWLLSKDCLEHVPYPELITAVRFFMQGTRKAALICVPLTLVENGPYVNDVDNRDSTHVIRWPFQQWLEFLQQQIDETGAPFLASGGYRLPGLKEYPTGLHNGCGFFTLRRYNK